MSLYEQALALEQQLRSVMKSIATMSREAQKSGSSDVAAILRGNLGTFIDTFLEADEDGMLDIMALVDDEINDGYDDDFYDDSKYLDYEGDDLYDEDFSSQKDDEYDDDDDYEPTEDDDMYDDIDNEGDYDDDEDADDDPAFEKMFQQFKKDSEMMGEDGFVSAMEQPVEDDDEEADEKPAKPSKKQDSEELEESRHSAGMGDWKKLVENSPPIDMKGGAAPSGGSEFDAIIASM